MVLDVTVFDHGSCTTTGHVKAVAVAGPSHALAYAAMISRLTRLEPFNVGFTTRVGRYLV